VRAARVLAQLPLLACSLVLVGPALAQEAPPESLPHLRPDAIGGARELREQDFYGRPRARGAYEIRSLAGDSILGSEEWELFEDDAGFRTLQATTALDVDGIRSSRTATITVDPELEFLEADGASTVGGIEAYASYRRAGDVLDVEAFSSSGETRQQVRFQSGSVFDSQIFAARGWELAPFRRDDNRTRPVYLSGSAPGVLVGEMRTFRAEARGREEITLRAGRFPSQRFSVTLPDEQAATSGEPVADAEDIWWVLPGTEIPLAAELPSLGVRVELVLYQEALLSGEEELPGPVLARGVYHHRPIRLREPLGVESWTLGRAEAGFYLDVDVSYRDGRSLTLRALADSLFMIREIHLRRRMGREAESVTFIVSDSALQAEARGGGVGLVRQSFPLTRGALFRLEVAALEGWAIAAGTETPPTYWLPTGPHPLGALLELPADVSLGEQRISTPARTFAARRFASPAQTPLLFRTVRWIFGPYRLPARVLFPALGREAVLVRYETPEE
jgi:hypothetical protein